MLLQSCLLSLALAQRLFSHESAPGYVLSAMDPTSLKVDNVNQHSGYIDTPSGDHLFYWMFESRSNPSSDPTVIWLNGGPGCSSLQAVLFENGPSNMDGDGNLHRNQWSWNNKANVIYLDQPARAGYSTGNSVTSSTTAAQDFAAFTRLFFHSFPQYAKSDFHIAGESYAGRYIPVFADGLINDPEQPVKLKSVLIGNGEVSDDAQYAAYEPMMCGQGGYPQVADQQECDMMQETQGQCLNAISSCENGNDLLCNTIQLSCNMLERSFSGRNPYDIRDSTCAQSKTGLCYPDMDTIQDFFNRNDVKQTLGADSSVDYQLCNDNINEGFTRAHDSVHLTTKNVTNLLNNDVAVLAFNGDKDIILNWLGTQQWTRNLDWSGKSQFSSAISNPQSWNHNNKQFGTVANYDKFTFLRVFDAGHMVPHDQPEAASRMFNSWIEKNYNFR